MDATDTLSRSLGLLDADEHFAPPMVRYYGTLVDDAQATGGEDGLVTNSDEATDLVRALVRPLGLEHAVEVVPGEFLGDYFVLVPVPYILPGFLEVDETWMEFETA
jgi:hypothetical protein